MIKRFYYTLWTDVILQLQKNPLNKKSWKWYSLFVMSFCFGFNYIPLLFILPKHINPFDYFLNIPFFEDGFLDRVSHGSIMILLPGCILHYFLVFYKKKYEKFTKEYPFRDGKLIYKHVLISFGVPSVMLIIAVIIGRLM